MDNQNADITQQHLTLPDLLKQLAPFFETLDMPIYLVGGAVRDAVVGKESNDLDFVVPTAGIQTAYQMGDYLKVPAYPLDKERDVGRVVLKENNTYIDVATYRGADIVEDLLDRDFTLNSLGLLATASTRSEILDPAGGLDDMAKRQVRMVTPTALTNDPLRMLRGIRMGLKFDFELESETAQTILNNGSMIERSSKERIRDELINILRTQPGQGVAQLEALGLLDYTLPLLWTSGDPRQSQIDQIAKTLKTLHSQLIPNRWDTYTASINAHLDRAISGGLNGRDVLILSGFYFCHHEIEPPPSYHGLEERLKNLKFSSEAISGVVTSLSNSQSFKKRISSRALSKRDKHRYWRTCGPAGLDTLLLHTNFSRLDEDGKKREMVLDTATQLMDHYIHFIDPQVKRPPLVSGHDLMHQLQLKPGPHIGKLLERIEEERVVSGFSTVEEAIDFAEQLMHSED